MRRSQPLRAELARPEAHRSMLESHFGCQVVFGATVDRIVFEQAALEVPFRTANPDLLAMLLSGLETALALEPATFRDAAFVDRVRETIRLQMQGKRPTMEAIGKELALSARSLQRRLSEASARRSKGLEKGALKHWWL